LCAISFTEFASATFTLSDFTYWIRNNWTKYKKSEGNLNVAILEATSFSLAKNLGCPWTINGCKSEIDLISVSNAERLILFPVTF
jgi:hypothetical protein